MNLLIRLIINIFSDLKKYGSNMLSLSKLQVENPTCRFYGGVNANDNLLGLYVVFYENVIISKSSVGSYTYIQKNSTIFNSHIGRFCSIASNVSIGPGNHKLDGVSTHPAFYDCDAPLPRVYSKETYCYSTIRTYIGNDVWIGERVIILDGIRVGDGAIIAAGSVVTKDVPPYSIVAGAPAVIKKMRFDEITINRILEINWWFNSDEWLQSNYKRFNSVKDLLTK